MFAFLLLFVLYVLFRRRSLAIAAMVLGLTAIYVVTHGGWLLANAPADHFPPSVADIVLFAAVQSAVVFAAVRFGVLTMLVASFVSLLLTLMPIALDSSVPYAFSSRVIVATVIALAAYGWRTALAGRPMFGAFFLRTNPPAARDQGNLKVSSSPNRLAQRYRRVQEAVMNNEQRNSVSNQCGGARWILAPTFTAPRHRDCPDLRLGRCARRRPRSRRRRWSRCSLTPTTRGRRRRCSPAMRARARAST